jgi:hypothetical protein
MRLSTAEAESLNMVVIIGRHQKNGIRPSRDYRPRNSAGSRTALISLHISSGISDTETYNCNRDIVHNAFNPDLLNLSRFILKTDSGQMSKSHIVEWNVGGELSFLSEHFK